MKGKFIKTIILAMTVFALVGCGKSEEATSGGETETPFVEVKEDEIKTMSDKYFEEFKKLLEEDKYKVKTEDSEKGLLGNDIIKADIDSNEKKEGIEECSLSSTELEKDVAFGVDISYKVDVDAIKNGKDIDISKLPFERYGKVLVKDLNFDYAELNKRINQTFKTVGVVARKSEIFEGNKEKDFIAITIYEDKINLEIMSSIYGYK